MYESSRFELALSPYTSPPPTPRSTGSLIAIVALIAIVVIAALVIFRGSLSDLIGDYFARGRQAAAYRDLELDVESMLETVDVQFSIIVHGTDQLASNFEDLTGIPLHLAHINSTEQIDDAILESRSFTNTFAQFLNRRITPESVNQQKQTLRLFRNHLQSRTLVDIHRSLLQQDLERIRSQQRLLEMQKTRLEQIANYIHDSVEPVNVTFVKGDLP